MNEVKGTPWEPVPGRGMTEVRSKVYIPSNREVTRMPEPEDRQTCVHRMSIRRSDLDRFGWHFRGCAGCEAANRGGPAVNHNEHCRKAYEAMLRQKDPQKYEKEKEKEAEKLARMIQKAASQEGSQQKKSRTGDGPTVIVNPSGELDQSGGAQASGGQERKREAEGPVEESKEPENKRSKAEEEGQGGEKPDEEIGGGEREQQTQD